MTIKYLNTDLELTSETDLTPLLAALGEEVLVLRNDHTEGVHTVWLETGLDYPDVASTMDAFCQQLEKLYDDTPHLWQTCQSRIANIGFESGKAPNSFAQHVPLETLQRLTALGIAITITVYPLR